MTCIVGIVREDDMWMGGDSAATDSSSINLRKDPKVFIRQDMLIGYCGSFRLGQLLRYKLQIPTKPKAKDVFEYLVNDFCSSLRSLAKDNGLMKVDNEIEEIPDSQIMICYDKRLFIIENDLHVGECLNNYNAIGGGQDVALGSLYTSEFNKNYGPKKRIEMALSAASSFCTAVSYPFHIINL